MKNDRKFRGQPNNIRYTHVILRKKVDVDYSSFLMFWKFQYSSFCKNFLNHDVMNFIIGVFIFNFYAKKKFLLMIGTITEDLRL